MQIYKTFFKCGVSLCKERHLWLTNEAVKYSKHVPSQWHYGCRLDDRGEMMSLERRVICKWWSVAVAGPGLWLGGTYCPVNIKKLERCLGHPLATAIHLPNVTAMNFQCICPTGWFSRAWEGTQFLFGASQQWKTGLVMADAFIAVDMTTMKSREGFQET